jgi:hypothetical protein
MDKMHPNDAGAKNFKFSNGWLEKFQDRHNIRSLRVYGESGSVNMEELERALPGIRDKLRGFSLRDIYNMDETGLFFRQQGANRGLATKKQKRHKLNKERVTVVICVNADGSDKGHLLFIGKSKNPRCMKPFKNDDSSLNTAYEANQKAWMTKLLFNDWLKSFDGSMDGHKGALLMDNCPAHGTEADLPPLKNTTVIFLPPNTTSMIQPCDAGIIHTFKAYF